MAEAANPPSDSTPRRRRWPFFLVVGLLVFVVGLRLALPRILEFALERVSSNLLAARLDIEDVHLDFYEGVIAVGAELRSRETEALLARVDAIELDIREHSAELWVIHDRDLERLTTSTGNFEDQADPTSI